MLRCAPLVVLVGCTACGEDGFSPPRLGECSSTASLAGALPAFCLYDRNPTSPTSGEAVSPRDYLESVSGWYFSTST